MNKNRLIVAILVPVIIAFLWAFFTYGGHKQPQAKTLTILHTQDKRLSQGSETAPVKIVEYADVLCPYCAKANLDTIPKIKAAYIDTNKAHYEVRLVALIAPDSQRAAEGAYCAAEQNKFWDYLNTAYQQTWNDYYSKGKTPEAIPLFQQGRIDEFARGLSLDMLKWNDCMQSGKYISVINANQTTMSQIKAYGTPHFIINGQNYNGAPPYSSFKAVIDEALHRAAQ